MIARADRIEGLAKGLAVLESFDPARQRLSASQVAERTGLSRAAARRQLLTLHEAGYLEVEDGHYWLSPRVLRLAGAYLSSARLPRVLQPVLDRLALATREACSAVVLDGAEVVIVARSLGGGPSSWPSLDGRVGRAWEGGTPLGAARVPMMAYGLHQGARLAAHATSTGLVLLAGLSAAELRSWIAAHAPLARFTAHTPHEPAALRAVLREVRQRDHSVAHQTHELGVHAVAVPVRNLAGRTIAAINIVTHPQRLEGPAFEALLLDPMRAAARELQSLV